jgi:uncharacterized membrane protein YjjP (DUF1212 family)
MTRTEQEKVFADLMVKCGDILLKKGNDYATVDRLSNFKEAGAVINIPPHMVALTMATIKISRIKSLSITCATPENESVQDSWIDLINYSILGYMCHMESSKK